MSKNQIDPKTKRDQHAIIWTVLFIGSVFSLFSIASELFNKLLILFFDLLDLIILFINTNNDVLFEFTFFYCVIGIFSWLISHLILEFYYYLFYPKLRGLKE